MNTIARRMKDARVAAGLSIGQAAKLIEETYHRNRVDIQRTLNEIEAGRGDAMVKMYALDFANLYGAEWLQTGKPDLDGVLRSHRQEARWPTQKRPRPHRQTLITMLPTR